MGNLGKVLAGLAASLAIASGARADPLASVPHFLMFSGFDLWRAGGFGHGGLLWSPQGVTAEGFAFKLLLGGGDYRYRSGPLEIDGRQFVGSALPGWRFKAGTLEVTVFAGLDVQNHRLRPDDLASRVRGAHAGLRGGAEFWWEPGSSTMITGALSLSTIGSNYWARLASGWRVFDVWVGPEFTAMGDADYQQWRLGAHVTALRLGEFEWSAGLGYVRDSDDRSGAYGRLGLLARR